MRSWRAWARDACGDSANRITGARACKAAARRECPVFDGFAAAGWGGGALPAMALVRHPAEPDIMRRPPRDPRESLVT
ncbi:MAG: cation transporting ATPase C-terminal domain-containing protein, partial [Candidatus Rokubacteria bacterium]|nr:cation transporting ATPase C-terminal domain-containing protein [Candidatus Rokubacteria bacterium]